MYTWHYVCNAHIVKMPLCSRDVVGRSTLDISSCVVGAVCCGLVSMTFGGRYNLIVAVQEEFQQCLMFVIEVSFYNCSF